MSHKPIISVIIVTYNRLQALKNCLESLRVQTLAKDRYEVIIVDDGSTDGSREFLQELRWPDGPEKRCFFNDHQGYVVARNFGAQQAAGDYVSFTDDDCIPEPEWLEKVVATFGQDETFGIVGSVTKVAFTNRLFQPLNQAFRKKREELAVPKIEFIEGSSGFVGLKPFSGCNLHIRKEIFQQLGGFDKSIGPAEDLDFLYRYLKRGGKTANRLDLHVDHYERDDMKSMFKRWFTFGKCDSEIVRRYLRAKLSLEVNLFHGLLDYRFITIPFPFSVYFHINLFKLVLALAVVAFIMPVVGFSMLLLFFAGLFLKQRNPKLTMSFLLYTFYLEASYALGALVGGLRRRVICI